MERSVSRAPGSALPLSTLSHLALAAIATAGGVAALSWQVLWQLRASVALGVSARGTALTLAAAMAGLGAGSLAMGWWLREREPPRPLRLYAALEVAIAGCGLLLPWGFAVLERLDAVLYRSAPALGPLAHGLGIALLLAPATCAMGATIPVFSRVARRHGTSLAALYAWNTAGAAGGVLLLTFALLPRLGVTASGLAVAGLNLAAAAAAALLAPPRAEPEPARGPEPAGPRSHARLPGDAIVVFGTGFVTFGLEVAWFRALRGAFQNTTDSFAYMLVAVLLPLAVGARAVPTLRRLGITPTPLLAAAGVAILMTTPLVERIDLYPRLAGGWQWLLPSSRLGLALLLFAPSMLLLGAALPWFLEEHRSPLRCGRLYAANTVGAVAGALIGAWLLLPTLGFARCAWLLGVASLLLSARGAGPRARGVAVAAGALSLAFAAATSSSPGRDRVHGAGPVSRHRVLAFDEGPDATASVIEHEGGNRKLVIDGFVTSAQGPRHTAYMDWMGWLPMQLHPQARRALVLCLGTGQTARAALEEGPSRLDVVELNPAVIEMADLFPANGGVLRDARVRTLVMDARAYLRRTEQRYDVITLEPMPPNFAGTNALYAAEFYGIAAQRLEPGGVVAQWLPLHLVTPFHAASITASFLAVLPDALLWIEPSSGTGILAGRVGGGPGGGAPLGLAWHRLVRGAPAERRPRDGLALYGAPLAAFARRGRLVTDDNQLLAYAQERGYPGRSPAHLASENHRLLREIAGGVSP